MLRWAMAIDLDRCTGCQACTFACISENNIPYARPDETARGVTMAWNEMVVYEEGQYPNPSEKIVPRPCMHCNEAPCVKVCPVGATYKREDGITMQDTGRCIGCRSCEVSCPYGARTFNWFDSKTRFAAMERTQNPLGQPLRPIGTVEKCVFCHQRLDRLRADLSAGKGPRIVREALGKRINGAGVTEALWSEAVDVLMRYYAEGKMSPNELDPTVTSYLPACVTVCPPQARLFGNVADPDSLVARSARDPRAFTLLEELGTHPNVVYLHKG